MTIARTPQDMIDDAAVALLEAWTAGLDVGEIVAHALCKVAATLGDIDRVVANRPGSWESELALRLMEGTVGDGEGLAEAFEPIQT